MDKQDFIKKIYEENYKFIASIIKSQLYSKNPHDISDCVQDVFKAALRKEDIQEHEKIKAWLCETAKNIVKQYNKKFLNAKNLGREIEDNDIITGDFSNQVIENDLFDGAIEKGVIEEAIKSLSYFERDFYNLRYKKKLSYKEISLITGKTENALNAKNTRIKQKIKMFLKDFIKNM